jgi:YfiH family protein
VSVAPYDSCNLGDHVGDDPAAVARNRAVAAEARSLPPPEEWGWMQQVHGRDVVVLDGPTGDDAPVADALVTRTRGLPLAVVTADCAPIALASDDAIAVVHAGHPGLLAGVIESALEALRAVGHGRVCALLGPCVRASRYEFGAADLAPLVEAFGPDVEARTEWGTIAFDVPAAVKIALTRGGVGEGDIADTALCTSGSARFFSYRRDGVTGRQATIAVLP